LQETREYAHGNITVRYTDPLKVLANDSSAGRFGDSMDYFYGLRALYDTSTLKGGERMNIKQVLPGAVIHYKDTAIVGQLIQRNKKLRHRTGATGGIV
jgi:hypothetical protein